MKKIFAFLLTCSFAILAITPLTFMGGGVSQTANAENEVIEISSATQLQEVANNVNEGNNDYAGATISLSWDIELTQSWMPIGTVGKPFRGTFDGNGWTISNITIDGEFTYQGLFGYTNGATIKNLNIAGTY